MNMENNQDKQALDALEKLRKRMLELSSRNKLINFRHPKSSLRIIDELPDQLVETLLQETEMPFLPVIEPTKSELMSAGFTTKDETGEAIPLKDVSAVKWAKHKGLETSFEMPFPSENTEDKHSDQAIQTVLYPHELEARLKKLSQTAKTAIEEMGANILYITFGFLEWYDADKPRHAPLFLLPVNLNKGRLNAKTNTYEYTLSYSGEDIIPNLSLREKLRADFALALPELNESTEPEVYFSEIQKLINEKKPDWKLRRYVTLALFDFSKLLMYLDLDPTRWPEGQSLADHPVISQYLGGSEADKHKEKSGSADSNFRAEYQIDDMPNVHSLYPLIDDADSSQHSAIIDILKGKSLVIEGPPGTGKSQTITNLIAAAMAQGKKVLFVAEKLAALEVVYNRLEKVGLGDFCLELHSHKSQKREILENVEKRLKRHGTYRNPKEINLDIARYERLKNDLKDHAIRVNLPWKETGKSIHEIFMAASRYRQEFDFQLNSYCPEGYNGSNFDINTQQEHQDLLQTYQKIYVKSFDTFDEHFTIEKHPWFGLTNKTIPNYEQALVQEKLEKWQENLLELNESYGEILGAITKENENILVCTKENIDTLLSQLETIPNIKGDELFSLLPQLHGTLLKDIQNEFTVFEKSKEVYCDLITKIKPEILDNPELVDGLGKSMQTLDGYLHPDVSRDLLSEMLPKLQSLSEILEGFEEPIKAIGVASGTEVSQHISLNYAGLLEFQKILIHVSALGSALWPLRSELFDKDEINDILPKISHDLNVLRQLQSELETVFICENFPEEYELFQLIETLKTKGMFRKLKGNWKEAKGTVISFTKGGNLNFNTAQASLPALLDFIKKKNSFQNNRLYHDVLGSHFLGMSTDTDSLKLLRQWYGHVRQEYGLGFGARMCIGDAILNFSETLARNLRLLNEHGGLERLGLALKELKELRGVFPILTDNNDHTLSGRDGLINQTYTKVKKGLNDSKILWADDHIVFGEITNLSKKMSYLLETKEEAKTFKLHALFSPYFNLSLETNETDISVMTNTLKFAENMEANLTHKGLREFLIENAAEEDFFSIMVALSNDIKEKVKSEAICFCEFKDFTELNDIDWLSGKAEYKDIIQRNKGALDNFHQLTSWIDYIKFRENLTNKGMAFLVQGTEKKAIPFEKIHTVYNAEIFNLLAREILHEIPELAQFSRNIQEDNQEQFIQCDNRLKELQCEYIAWKIDQVDIPIGLPGPRVNDKTERCLLDHEVNKRTRHIPIRKLLDRAGNALSTLKPCFMMGPMSAAQYLKPGHLEFDLVIMDEASQIKPQDALGVIARGKQLVVVGDPKQMPPTNFFSRAMDEDEEDQTTIEESESILDATLPMFPSRRLRWHYRSQHQSLIAFSNKFFYDSDLVLFPSPYQKTDKYGIQYFKVEDGSFSESKNEAEARIIAKNVLEHMQKHPKDTLGVVAMNTKQRDLIEMELENITKEDVLFQTLFDNNSKEDEPLFIKNLENVQGDERDVIFISMTYGPSQPRGKLYQRFGPINSEMGWRRLNVLFTRSRKRMHVFSSMGSQDILVTPTSKRGVKALRDFLKFCETDNLDCIETETGRAPDSDFEISVMAQLRDAGFECVPQVGVAGFFIDLAVKDPGNPSRYLMGIECDGATYHSAKSVRDRDRLRQTILERLGWEIRRIWSTDWFSNPNGELKPIIEELNKMKTIISQEWEEEFTEVIKKEKQEEEEAV